MICTFIIPLVIISGHGVNHTMSKRIVSQFPEEIYEKIDKVEFSSKERDDINAYYRFWFWTKDDRRVSYEANIILYNSVGASYSRLFLDMQHELGHHDYFYWQGKEYTKEPEMEEYAEEFDIYQWGVSDDADT